LTNHRYSDSNVTVGSNIRRRVSELLHFKLEFTIARISTSRRASWVRGFTAGGILMRSSQ